MPRPKKRAAPGLAAWSLLVALLPALLLGSVVGARTIRLHSHGAAGGHLVSFDPADAHAAIRDHHEHAEDHHHHGEPAPSGR